MIFDGYQQFQLPDGYYKRCPLCGKEWGNTDQYGTQSKIQFIQYACGSDNIFLQAENCCIIGYRETGEIGVWISGGEFKFFDNMQQVHCYFRNKAFW